MAGLFQKLLSRGSQTAPRIVDDLVTSNGLKKRLAEEGTEVLGEGMSRGAKSATGEVPDAAWREIIPEKKVSSLDALIQSAKENPKTAAALTALTGGTIANQFMGNEPTQVPFRPEAQMPASESILPANYNKLAQDEANDQDKTVRAEAPKKDGLDADASIKDQTPEIAPVSDSDNDFMKIREVAKSQRDKSDWEAGLLRASEQLAGGLSRSSVDYGSSDLKRKQGERYTEDADADIGAIQKQQSFDKTKLELNDDSAMRDPNSDISRMVTQIASKVGILKPGQTASAMDLKNAGVNLGMLLATIEAGKARTEAASLAREGRNADKQTQNQLKVQSSVDKQVSQLYKSKDMEAFNAAKDATFALDNALDSNDNKIAGGTAFMQYAKIAQNDNSVVRDGDMAQLAGRYNYTSVSDMFSKLKAQASGGNFGKIELAAMKEIAELTKRIKGDRVKQQLNPIIERASAANLNLSETLDPTFVEQFSDSKSSTDNNSKSGKKLVNKQYSKSRNQTKLIFSDGTEEVVDGKR